MPSTAMLCYLLFYCAIVELGRSEIASFDRKAARTNFLLDLVEWESLCGSHIADKIVNCLLNSGYTIANCSKKYSFDLAVGQSQESEN